MTKTIIRIMMITKNGSNNNNVYGQNDQPDGCNSRSDDYES